jgi:hypothetical protein
MNNNTISLRHITFTGPSKEAANLDFDQGLNIIYGASDTGKSFVLEAIDFMLGGNTALRDIPERVGYDRIFLGMQIGNDLLTLVRSTGGGAFHQYDGLIKEIPANKEPVILGAKHSAKTSDNLSAFLLEKIGFENKILKTNAQGKTRPVSLRDLVHLCAIDETKIQSKISPIESGQRIFKTVEYSLFKLLLTGVDDSSFIPELNKNKKQQNQHPKIELLDELLLSYNTQLGKGITEKDLKDQLFKMESSIKEFQQGLNTYETSYQELLGKKNILNKKVEDATLRRYEIGEVKARFDLLNSHYNSDLQRLEGIREVGSLLGALEPKSCPLCGALPDHQHPEDTLSNLDLIVTACFAEEQKIKKLQSELVATIEQLRDEALAFDVKIPILYSEKNENATHINTIWNKLLNQRTEFSELVEKRSAVRESITLVNQIKELSALKIAIENESKNTKKDKGDDEIIVDFSTSTLTEFEVEIEKILKDWNFPDSDRVKFEESTKDLIISGKRRASRGKGMRSITHSAFTIGILEFCKLKGLGHPGFIILDSPLLAYREPEGEPEEGDNDLVQANVQDKFYEYLAKWTDRQIIIIENVTPPIAVTNNPNSLMFSKNEKIGRYGYFPK